MTAGAVTRTSILAALWKFSEEFLLAQVYGGIRFKDVSDDSPLNVRVLQQHRPLHCFVSVFFLPHLIKRSIMEAPHQGFNSKPLC